MEQTPRTKQKLQENTDLLVGSMPDIIGMGLDSWTRQRLQRVIYDALLWTADDVLKQANEP